MNFVSVELQAFIIPDGTCTFIMACENAGAIAATKMDAQASSATKRYFKLCLICTRTITKYYIPQFGLHQIH